jgi:ankyrin repeat protein
MGARAWRMRLVAGASLPLVGLALGFMCVRYCGGSRAVVGAVWRGRHWEARLLLALGADATASDKRGYRAIDAAAATGAADLIRNLVRRGADPNEDRTGTPPLARACKDGQVDAAAVLIESGADVDARDASGIPVLWWAVFRRTEGPALTDLLLRAGGDPGGGPGPTWIRPLEAAIYRAGADGDPPERMRLLLEAGADPNAVDRGGNTPLHLAEYMDCAPAVQLLLRYGADPLRRDAKGRTAGDLASQQGQEAIAALLWAAESGARHRSPP